MTCHESPDVGPSIVLTKPLLGECLGSVVRVEGMGTAFEGTISIRIVDQAGTVLGHTFAIGGALGTLEPFSTEVAMTKHPTTTDGYIEAYELSAKDGYEMNLYRVAVSFKDFDDREKESVSDE